MSVLTQLPENEKTKNQPVVPLAAPVIGRPQIPPHDGPVQNVATLPRYDVVQTPDVNTTLPSAATELKQFKTVVQSSPDVQVSPELKQPSIVQVEGVDAQHPDQDDAIRDQEIAKNLNQLGVAEANSQNVQPAVNQALNFPTKDEFVDNMIAGPKKDVDKLNSSFADQEVHSTAYDSSSYFRNLWGQILTTIGIAQIMPDAGHPTSVSTESTQFNEENKERFGKMGMNAPNSSVVPAITEPLKQPATDVVADTPFVPGKLELVAKQPGGPAIPAHNIVSARPTTTPQAFVSPELQTSDLQKRDAA